MKQKKGLIAFCTLFTIAVFLSIFLMTWFWGDKYEDFKSSVFREEVTIPGLKDGACPQGLAMVSYNLYNKDGEVETDSNANKLTQDYYFISAYFKNKPSRIYVTGKESGYLGYVTLTYDGKPFYGHVGGVATNEQGNWLWLASEDKVYCVKCSDKEYNNKVVEEIIVKSLSKGVLELQSYFQINGSASFISYFKATNDADKLYVGEFYRAGNYETPSNHHLKTPDGGTQRAFMYEFRVSSTTTGNYGLQLTDNSKMSEQVPKVECIYSIPDRIQGVARISGSSDSGDAFILSQSYGLANSQILMYDYNTVRGKKDLYTTFDPEGFEYKGVHIRDQEDKPYKDDSKLDVYYIYGSYNSKKEDSQGNKLYPSFYRSYSIPSMSEGLAVGSNGRVNILFESAANKYKLFVRQPLDKIYSFMPTKR